MKTTTCLAIAGPPQANSDFYTMMTTYNGNGSPGGAPTGIGPTSSA